MISQDSAPLDGQKPTGFTATWAPAGARIHTITPKGPDDGGPDIRVLRAGSGPPLVLLHTMRTQLDYFYRLVPRLTDHFTVYAVDLPGHGNSEIRPVPHDAPYIIGALVGLIRQLKLRHVTVAGESIGAVAALALAAALPTQIKRVVAMNPYDYGERFGGGIRRGNSWARWIIGSLKIPLIGPLNLALENRFLLTRILRGGVVNPGHLERDLLAEFDRVGRRTGYRPMELSLFRHWRSWREMRARYREVACPVTLIYGEHDWSHPHERIDAALLPAAQVHTLGGVGHFSALEAPEQLARLMVAPAHPLTLSA